MLRFKIRADTVHLPGVGVLTKTGSGYWSDWLTTSAPRELLTPHEHADPESPDRASMPGKVAYVEPVPKAFVDMTPEERGAAALAQLPPKLRTPEAFEPDETVTIFDEDTPVEIVKPKPKRKR